MSKVDPNRIHRCCCKLTGVSEPAKTSQWLSLPPIINCAMQRTDFRHVSLVYSFPSSLRSALWGAGEEEIPKLYPYCYDYQLHSQLKRYHVSHKSLNLLIIQLINCYNYMIKELASLSLRSIFHRQYPQTF